METFKAELLFGFYEKAIRINAKVGIRIGRIKICDFDSDSVFLYPSYKYR